MKVLAVVPDGNVMDRVRWLAQWNADIEWDVVSIGPDCFWEPNGWAKSFRCLDLVYRDVRDHPQKDVELPDLGAVQYEYECCHLRNPLLGYWYHYDVQQIVAGIMLLRETLYSSEFDVLVTWGERGWYNETAIEIAEERGVPVCRLERATFPGMYVADGTGLEQGRCDLRKWHHRIVDQSMSSAMTRQGMFDHWLSVAPWQAIESQPRTTLGMVKQIADGRPSVFVPLQVPVDTNMVFRSNTVHNNFELLEYVRANYQDYQIIVKKHPGDGFTSPEGLEWYCQEHGLTLVNMATHPILQWVDSVVSLNSQCIIEAWMHNTPVEILGQPAFDLPDETDKQALLYTLRFAYYVEPWQFNERLYWIAGAD